MAKKKCKYYLLLHPIHYFSPVTGDTVDTLTDTQGPTRFTLVVPICHESDMNPFVKQIYTPRLMQMYKHSLSGWKVEFGAAKLMCPR